MTSVTLHLDRWGINMVANIPVFQPESPVQAAPNKVQGALDHRKMAQTPDLRDDLRFIQQQQLQNRRPTGERPMLKPPSATQGIQNFQNIP